MEKSILETSESGDAIKKRTLVTDPQYFGSYLNMARHNVFTINNHIAEKMNIKLHKERYDKLPDEENIPNSFMINEIKEKPNLFYTQLIRFLPIAKVYSNELLPKEEKETSGKEGTDYKVLAKDLKICFKELNDFRNDYSHYYSKTNGTKRKIVINENLSIFLRTNKQRAIEYTKKRFTGVFEDKDFGIVEKMEFVESSNKITQEGIIFFTCLFLEREYAFQFINRIIGLKGTTTPHFRATREVFLAFCVNLPHDKFISDDPEQGFILDMLNELNRCPKELYNSITDEEKKQFQPDVKDKISQIEENSTPDDLPEEKYEDYIKGITSKTRRTDRFPYFALKYLDSKDDFHLLFHLKLGKVLLDTYKKTILEKEEDRDIVEEAKVFGKLKDFENEKESIKKIDARNNLLFELFHPDFYIKNNKIGFSFESKPKITNYIKDEKGKWIQKFSFQNPDGFLSARELPKVVLLELLQKGKTEEIIKSFLEKNENKILNKDFIEKVKNQLAFDKPFTRSFQKKKSEAYSEKGKEILAGRKTKLNEILYQYNLTDKQIPERIIDYWLNIVDVKDEMSIANKIKAMKKDCKDRMKKLNNIKKSPKIGEMASYLAKDIVNMVIDEKVKSKITSFYYDKIQECVALYADSEKKKLLIDILGKELKLFDKEKGHPFLSDLNMGNINKTSEFYEKYIIKKGGMEKIWNAKKEKFNDVDKSWLHETFYIKVFNEEKKKPETKIVLPDDLSQIPFSIRNLAKEKSNFDKWLSNVTKGCEEKDNPKPVDLPTNIFDETLVSLLREKLKVKNIQYKEIDKFSKLFDLYCSDTQPFYNAVREYKVYDKTIIFKPGTKERFKEYFEEVFYKVYEEKKAIREKERETNKRLPPIQKMDILGVYNDAITENEKIIRFYQTKDRVLLLMIIDLMKSEKKLGIKLNDIFPLSEKSPLNFQELISQKIEGLLSYDNESKFLKKEERTQTILKTITDTRKRKDFSVFRKLVFDKRLPELFEYFKEETISYPLLNNELDEYNKLKEFVFDKIFELEKAIIEKPNVIKEINLGTKDNIQHEPYLEWMINKKIIDEEQKKLFGVIRNSFSHNQFPPKIVTGKFIEHKEKNISKQIVEKYIIEIEKIILKIGKL